MARLASFLYRNWRGIYFFQRRLPAQLRLIVPGLPRLFRRSLATRDHATALCLARKLSVVFDELAKTYFATKADYERGIKLLREYRIAERQHPTFPAIEEHFLINLDDYEDHLLDSAIALLKTRGPQGSSRHEAPAGMTKADLGRRADLLRRSQSSAGAVSEAGLHSKPVSEAFKEFIAEKRHSWKSTNGSEGQYTQEVLPLFIELNGDLETAKINKTHVTVFARAVLALPKNRRKMPEYRDLTIFELMKLSIPKDRQLSSTTRRNYMRRLSSVLHWLEDHDYAQRNLYAPLKTPVFKKVTRANQERAQYTDAELAKLFNSDDYIQGLHKYSFQYWVPLIGLFTGARENEICQLFTSDIRKDEETDTWVFDFNENDAETHQEVVEAARPCKNVPDTQTVDHPRHPGVREPPTPTERGAAFPGTSLPWQEQVR